MGEPNHPGTRGLPPNNRGPGERSNRGELADWIGLPDVTFPAPTHAHASHLSAPGVDIVTIFEAAGRCEARRDACDLRSHVYKRPSQGGGSDWRRLEALAFGWWVAVRVTTFTFVLPGPER
jgi:hypothetical protein